jgi:hypothetical protein
MLSFDHVTRLGCSRLDRLREFDPRRVLLAHDLASSEAAR